MNSEKKQDAASLKAALYEAAADGKLDKVVECIEAGADLSCPKEGESVRPSFSKVQTDMLRFALGQFQLDGRNATTTFPKDVRFGHQDSGPERSLLMRIAKVYLAAGGDVETGWKRGDYKNYASYAPALYDYVKRVVNGKEPRPTVESLAAEGIKLNLKKEAPAHKDESVHDAVAKTHAEAISASMDSFESAKTYRFMELMVAGKPFKPTPRYLYMAAASGNVEKFASYIEQGGDVNARDESYEGDVLGAVFLEYYMRPQEFGYMNGLNNQKFKTHEEQEKILLKLAKIYVAAGGDLKFGFGNNGNYDLMENAFPKVFEYLEDAFYGLEPKPTKESLAAEGIDFDPLKNAQARGAEKYEKEQAAREAAGVYPNEDALRGSDSQYDFRQKPTLKLTSPLNDGMVEVAAEHVRK